MTKLWQKGRKLWNDTKLWLQCMAKNFGDILQKVAWIFLISWLHNFQIFYNFMTFCHTIAPSNIQELKALANLEIFLQIYQKQKDRKLLVPCTIFNKSNSLLWIVFGHHASVEMQENYLSSSRNFYLGEVLTFYPFWGEKLDLIFTQ